MAAARCGLQCYLHRYGLNWPAQPVCCPHQSSRLTRGQRSKNMAESDVEELEGNLHNKII